MQYHDFLAQVERRAELTTSSGEAKTAIQATLETFCDHLAGNAPAKLAAQLSRLIKTTLMRKARVLESKNLSAASRKKSGWKTKSKPAIKQPRF
jgi:uncharacterized protein (DUF2267 family)